MLDLVTCPICSQSVKSTQINSHIDSGCSATSITASLGHKRSVSESTSQSSSTKAGKSLSSQPKNIAPIFNKVVEQLPSPASGSSVKRAADGKSTQEEPPLKRSRINLQDAAPLAEKLRPTALSDFVGHELIVSLIASGFCGSLVLWGPSGCGKTTLARLIAAQADAAFKELSATVAGINDVKGIVEAAKSMLSLTGRKTILFLDEIHRFNKGQQDVFLPFLEKGYIQLIGATTENPSFKLIGALLSRCRVFSLQRLEDVDIKTIVTKALHRLSNISTQLPMGLSQPATSVQAPPIRSLSQKIIATIVCMSAGDARIAISLLELAVKAPHDFDEGKILTMLRRSVATSYDTAEDHYNMISALHKSIRGSQPDAAMYWLARMLAGGEDPVYICRRMVVCASEDIGLADNHALPLAVAALNSCQNIGMPECRINLAHLVAYLSEAPKSTRAYEAYKRAEEAAVKHPSLPVPLQMRNAPTSLMKEVGYGESYLYNPDYKHPVQNTYLPLQLENIEFLKKAGDDSGKLWDEDALVSWETHNGKRWEGRDQTP